MRLVPSTVASLFFLRLLTHYPRRSVREWETRASSTVSPVKVCRCCASSCLYTCGSLPGQPWLPSAQPVVPSMHYPRHERISIESEGIGDDSSFAVLTWGVGRGFLEVPAATYDPRHYPGDQRGAEITFAERRGLADVSAALLRRLTAIQVVARALMSSPELINWGLVPRACLGLLALLCGNGYIVGINQARLLTRPAMVRG